MSSIRVLLIDDDSTARQGFATYLQYVAEFEVTECENGDKALRHLKNKADAYTVVLLDFVLGPPITGNQVLAEIRSLYPRLPVIVFTGRDPYGGVQTLEKGAYRYMRRPLDHVELVNTIRNLAEQDTKLREMAADIRDMLESDLCIAWRLDKKEGQFRVTAWDGDLDEAYGETIFLSAETMQKRKSLQKGEPISLSDVTNPQRAPLYLHRQEAQKRGWTSLICVPLVHNKRIIGFIDSYTYQAFKFNGHRRFIMSSLRAFANQAAESIRNIELSNRFETLQDINQLLTGIFDEQTIVRQILAKGIELVGANLGHVYLMDINRCCLVLKESIGIPDEQVEHKRELGQGLTGDVAQTGVAENIPDVSKDARHTPIPGVEINSKVAVPLRREEQIIGVLSVKSRFYNAFTDDDVNLLTALATQAAIAIERARLNRHLQEVSRLALGEDYTVLLNYVVNAVRDLTGADTNLWMIGGTEEGRGQYLQIVASSGEMRENYIKNTQLRMDSNNSINVEALKQKQTIIREDIQNDLKKPQFYHLDRARKRGWHSFMAVPLIGQEDKPLGTLSLYSKEIAKFGQPEVQLMQTFANQVAIALQQQKRAFALQQLAQVGQTLSENMTDQPKRLLEKVADIARRLTRADCIVIYPYDPVKKRFYEKESIAALGVQHPLQDVADKPRETGLAASVRQAGTIVVHDIDQNNVEIALETTNQQGVDREQILQTIFKAKFVQREGIKAFVGVSLRANERVDGQQNHAEEVGILYINFRKPHHFSNEELQIIKIFAHQVANIIRGARLYSEAQRQNSELEAVHQTALKIVAQEEDVNSLLEALVEEATNLLKAKGGKVYLRVPNEDKIELVAAKNVDASLLPLRSRLSFGEGVAGEVFISKEPLIIDDYAECEWCVEELAHLFTAIIEVPLLLKGEAIGVLCVFDDAEKRRFTSQDIPILQRLAQQASLAIHNATLFDKSQKRLQVLDALHETSLDIVGRLEFDKLMREIIERAAKLVAGEGDKGIGAAYLRCDYEQEKAIIEYSRNPDFERIELALNESLVGEVIQTGRAQYVNDFPHWPHRAQIFDKRNLVRFMQNVIEVPVKEDEKVMAIIAISDATGKRQFSEADIELLERFADLTAIAIQNASLMQQERTLREVSNAIKSNLTLTEVADIILTEWHKVVEFRKATIQLFEGEERTLLAYHGFDDEGIDEWLLRPISKDRLVSDIVESQDPLILTHSRQHPDWEVLPCTSDVKSWVGLPLIYGGDVIGLLTLDHDHSGFYTELHRDQLVLFANQTAVAIQKAHLLETTQRRIRDLEIVNHVVEIISTKLIGEKWLDEIVSQIANNLKCTHCTLYLAQEKNNEWWLVPQATHGKFHKQVIASPFKSGEGVAGWVFEHGKAALVTDTSRDTRFKPAPKDQYEPRSLLVVPIKANEKTMGVISVEHVRTDQFSTPDLHFVETLARHIGIAIERTQSLHLLQDIGHRIISAQDVEETLRQIVLGAIKLTNVTAGVIYLLSEDEKSVIKHLQYPTDFYLPKPRISKAKGITLEVVKTGKVIMIPDTHQDERINPKIYSNVRSMIALPLSTQNVVGVLFLHHSIIRDFTETEVSLLSTLARQAAIALQNARLFDEAQRRIRDLQIVNNIVQIINTKLESKELLNAIVSQIAENLNCTHCSLFMPQEEGCEIWLLPQVSHGPLSKDISCSPRRLKSDEGIAGWVFQKCKSVVLPDARLDERFVPARARQDMPRSMLVVPVKVREQTMGVITADQDQYGWFDEHDKRLVEALAQHVGIAIERANLFDQIQSQREAQTRAIHEIAHSIPTEKPLHEILQSLLGWTLSLMGEASLGEIRLLDDKTNELVVKASHGELRQEFRRLAVGKGITGWVAEHKTYQLIGDVRKDKRYVQFLEETRSELAVPMLREDKLIGVLNIEHPELNAFTQDDVKLAEAIAGLAVVAIENNRLFEQLTDRATRLERLHKVTATISAEPSDLENVLRLIVDSLSEIFCDSQCVIRLYDTKKDEFTHQVAQTTGVPKEQTVDAPRSNGISRYVLKTKKPYYVEDSDHMPPAGQPTIRQTIVNQGVRAMAALPLLSENEVIGILYLNLKTPHQFTQNDEQILELFANQTAVAVKNAQLYRQIQAQSEAEIKAIRKIATSISIAASLGIKEVLQRIIHSMVPLMGRSNLFNVRLLDKKTNELLLVASEGEIYEERFSYRLKIGEGVIGWVAQHKIPLVVPDVRKDDRYLPGLVGGRSELAVPMLKADELIGVLNIEHPEVNAFTQSDVQLAEAIAGLAVVALENNQLQEAQERATAAEKLAVMGHVTAEFMHRMNNLAGTIPPRLNMAKEYLRDDEPRDAKVIKQLNKVTADTLLLLDAVQKIKRTTEQREPEDVQVNQLLEKALQIVCSSQPEAEGQIEVERQFALDLPVLHLDRRHLLDCLISVIRNAVQAMPNGGTLTLSTVKSTMKGKPCVEIAIKDNGVGISAENLSKIFQLFFTTKQKGLGYGLWRDKTLIKMLGGDIEAESVEGVGSTFTIQLPVV